MKSQLIHISADLISTSCSSYSPAVPPPAPRQPQSDFFNPIELAIHGDVFVELNNVLFVAFLAFTTNITNNIQVPTTHLHALQRLR